MRFRRRLYTKTRGFVYDIAPLLHLIVTLLHFSAPAYVVFCAVYNAPRPLPFQPLLNRFKPHSPPKRQAGLPQLQSVPIPQA